MISSRPSVGNLRDAIRAFLYLEDVDATLMVTALPVIYDLADLFTHEAVVNEFAQYSDSERQQAHLFQASRLSPHGTLEMTAPHSVLCTTAISHCSHLQSSELDCIRGYNLLTYSYDNIIYEGLL